MSWFMGLDSSTQSLSALGIDVDSGRIVFEESVEFGADLAEYGCPQGFRPDPDPQVRQADPLLWAAALDLLCARLRTAGVDLSRVRGICGSGQQHGSVYLNAGFAERGLASDADLVSRVRPCLSRARAPIWMDSSTGPECAEITAAVGTEVLRQRSGSPAIERFTGPQIRKFSKEDPEAYAATAVIHLVSSFMASLLIGRSAPIDFGDAAGMNLLNLQDGDWDPVLLNATAADLARRLPAPVPGTTIAGEVATYFVERYGFRPGTPVVAWSGDNPSSLIGVGGWRVGTAVISLGTSDTFFAAMSGPVVDPAGCGHVFGNPAGGFMSLICFTNGSLAREQVRQRHGLDWSGFEECLTATEPGNNGNLMLPYFEPETTPLIRQPRVIRNGSDAFVNGQDAAAAVRAVIEAQAARLRLHSAWIGARPRTLKVTGGGAANTAICQVLADVFQATVQRLQTGNSAALGAALRAANAVAGATWEDLAAAFCRPRPGMDVCPNPDRAAAYDAMCAAYTELAATVDG